MLDRPGDLAAAAIDQAVDLRLGPLEQGPQVGEARVQQVGHVGGGGVEGLAQALGPGRDRVGEFLAAHLHEVAQTGLGLLEQGAQALRAAVERRGELALAGLDQSGDGGGRLLQHRPKGLDLGVDRGGEAATAALHHRVEGVVGFLEQGPQALGAGIQGLGETVAAALDQVLQVTEALVEQAAERLRPGIEAAGGAAKGFFDGGDQGAAAGIQRLVERAHAAVQGAGQGAGMAVQHHADLVGAVVEQAVDRAHALVEQAADVGGAARQGVAQAALAGFEHALGIRDGLLELGQDALAALVDQLGQRGAAAVEQARQLGDAAADRPEHGPALLVELARHGGDALVDQLRQQLRALGEGRAHGLGAGGEGRVGALGPLVDQLDDLLDAARQRGFEDARRFRDGAGEGADALGHRLVDPAGPVGDRGDQVAGPAGQFLVDRAGARLDQADRLEGLHAEALVHQAGALLQGVGDLLQAVDDAGVEMLRAARDAAGHLGGAPVDILPEPFGPAIEHRDQVAAALVHDPGHLPGPGGQRLVQGLAAGIDPVVDMVDQVRHELADLGRALGRALLERAEMGLDQAAGLAGAGRDGLGHGLALDGDEPVHLLQPRPDGLAEMGRVAADAVGQDVAAGDGLLQGGEAAAQRLVDGPDTAVRGLGEARAGLAERVGDAGALARHREHDVAAGAADPGLGLLGVAGQELGDALAVRAEGRLHLADAGGEVVRDGAGGLRQAAGGIVGAGRQLAVEVVQGGAQGGHRRGTALAELGAGAVGGVAEAGEQARGLGLDGAGHLGRAVAQGLEGIDQAGGGVAGMGLDLAGDRAGGAAQGLDGGGGPGLEAVAQRREGGFQGLGCGLGPIGDVAAGPLGRGLDAGLEIRGLHRHGVVQARGDPVHPLGQGVAALRDRLGDPLGGADQLVAHRAGLVGQRLADAAHGEREGGLRVAAAALDRLGDGEAGILDLAAQRQAAAGDVLGERGARLGEARGDLGPHRAETLRQLGAARQEGVLEADDRALEALAHDAALALQGLADAQAGLGQALGDGGGALGDPPGKGIPGRLEGAAHVAGAGLEGPRQGLADLQEAAAHALAGVRQALDQLVAAPGHQVDDPVARVAQGSRDGRAAGVERPGHALAGAGQRHDDPLGRAFQLLAQALVRAGDRAAHALGVGDDGFPLGDQFLDQGADADLVVGIGPLQRGDLAADQGLQLAGPGERTLDAVADRGDFPAHGLRHGQDGIGGEAFGLGQAHRDLADRAGDEAHLLGPGRQHGGDHEQDDRAEQGGSAHRRLEGGEARDDAAQVAAGLQPGDQNQAGDPGEAGQEGENIGLGRGPHPQGLLQDADVAPVVIRHQRAVGRQQAALAARALAAGRGQVGSQRRVEVEARRRLAAGRIEGAVEQRIGIPDIGQARLGAALGAGRRQGVEVQRLLDRRERGLGRVLQLLLGRHSTPRHTGFTGTWGG